MKRRMKRIWLDLETTGLEDTDAILEVGVVIAEEFKIIAQRNWLANDSGYICRELRPRVYDMHTNNGLFDEIRCSGLAMPLPQIDEEIVKYLEEHMDKGQPWKLAGSSIHFDRKFIDKQMPRLSNRLHYRMLDVSAIKESLSDWAPDLVDGRPQPMGLHRALPDCIDSLHEWQYYKDVLLGSA